MTSRMWFTQILRGIGIWKIFAGLESLTTAWNLHAKYFTTPYESAPSFIGLGFVEIFFGLILLFFAAAIAALIVPAERAMPATEVDNRKP